MPLVVFNQQIVTGRSLQPIHYQVFIGNYVAGLALCLTLGIFLRNRLNGAIARETGLQHDGDCAVVWGFVECHYTVRVLDEANVERDEFVPRRPPA